ncbi:MAG TPA: ion transporter [Egibacteraceae bacterium]|nr:ion transporter [Egibacteraceae bacterium]
MSDDTPPTIGPDPDDEPSRRERLAALIEERLDIPMAVLAVAWAVLVAYDLVAPPEMREELALAGNVIWAVFVVEFVLKLSVSGRPVRFLRRRWPSVLFLLLPALRMFRVLRAVRALRALPAARVIGSSYRAVGTARNLLQGRLTFLMTATGIAVFSSAQMLYLLERGRDGGVRGLGDALWWSANLAVTGNLVFDPVTLLGRVLAILLSAYSVVVFASVAAALGAFFIEARAERAAVEEEAGGDA